MVCRKYTDEDIKFIQNNYRTKNYAEIAKHLGRTSSSVKVMAGRQLKLKRTPEERAKICKEVKHSNALPPGKLELLRANFGKMSDRIVAKLVGCSYVSVTRIAKRLKLTRPDKLGKEKHLGAWRIEGSANTSRKKYHQAKWQKEHGKLRKMSILVYLTADYDNYNDLRKIRKILYNNFITRRDARIAKQQEKKMAEVEKIAKREARLATENQATADRLVRIEKRRLTKIEKEKEKATKKLAKLKAKEGKIIREAAEKEARVQARLEKRRQSVQARLDAKAAKRKAKLDKNISREVNFALNLGVIPTARVTPRVVDRHTSPRKIERMEQALKHEKFKAEYKQKTVAEAVIELADQGRVPVRLDEKTVVWPLKEKCVLMPDGTWKRKSDLKKEKQHEGER